MMAFSIRKQQGPAFAFQLARLSALVADMEAIGRGLAPEGLVEGEAPLLDRWILGRLPVPCLVGLSTGHPRVPGENRPIGTSDVWLISEDRGWARTLSRWYRLGRPAGHDDLHS
ncbi:MAG: hypothetical protein EOR67_21555 [Mesorhizobium sp.]|uniref:DUF6634 family protein n=1 Tax=Mesorhizobium sp. TaxID=1871066 RepID=UPI000FE8EBB3|nr:DUF6634 family protein [Mesorhizobium sp.]RWL85658.1 MAG: hypothetical protein EOR67_21555 [Mesorhizobium sp.]